MWIKFAPWIGCVVLGGLWLDARDAIIEEREGCNTSKVEEALEAKTEVATAKQAEHDRQIRELLEIVDRQRRAKEIAVEAAELAESRPAKVQTIIERITDEEACMGAVVPTVLVDGVFDD